MRDDRRKVTREEAEDTVVALRKWLTRLGLDKLWDVTIRTIATDSEATTWADTEANHRSKTVTFTVYYGIKVTGDPNPDETALHEIVHLFTSRMDGTVNDMVETLKHVNTQLGNALRSAYMDSTEEVTSDLARLLMVMNKEKSDCSSDMDNDSRCGGKCCSCDSVVDEPTITSEKCFDA